MRKVAFFFIALMITTALFTCFSCTDKKPVANADTILADSGVVDTSSTDTLEDIIAAQPMPKAADELFDDFFFNFAANRKLQRKRILFPLPVYKNGKIEKKIEKGKWRMEHFFMHQDFYTLIFDNRKQMNVVKDTTISHVIVEKIFFDIKTVQQFLFNRIDGQWMMTSINYKPMYKNKNASFLKFFHRFVSDKDFQYSSINDPLDFSGPDPDDDFGTMTGTLAPEQWSSFAPQLPEGMIYNIIYGQKYTESTQKIFCIRGIANGLETELSFRKIGDRWKLVKLTM